jgi:acyl-CoA thioesterase-1
VLALGDSLVAGYGLPRAETFPVKLEQRLRAEGYPAEVIDGGVSGDTSEGGRNRVAWVLEPDTDVAIVELGGNDGLRGLDPEVTRRNLAAIIETLQKKDVAVILTGMLAPPNMGAEYGAEFNAVFPALAEEYDVVYDRFFLEGVAAQPDLNQADGIHPNAAGVERIVERFWPIVARTLVAELGAGAFPDGSALPPREARR